MASMAQEWVSPRTGYLFVGSNVILGKCPSIEDPEEKLLAKVIKAKYMDVY